MKSVSKGHSENFRKAGEEKLISSLSFSNLMTVNWTEGATPVNQAVSVSGRGNTLSVMEHYC